MNNLEKRTFVNETLPDRPEKKGMKESLENFGRNLIGKIDKLLGNFKSIESEFENMDKSVDLMPQEIDSVRAETKIVENIGYLNQDASQVAKDSEAEIAAIINTNNSIDKSKENKDGHVEDLDFFNRAEKHIKTGEFDLAKDNFLLLDDNIEQGALLERHPQFREFYEKSSMDEAKNWLNDKRNWIEPAFSPVTSIKNVLKQPSGDAREIALKNYKENLVRQKEAFSRVIVYSESLFRYSPQIKEKEFLAELDKYSADFAFDADRKQIIIEAFYKFEDRRKNVADLQEKFTSDQSLFKELFGVEPEGKIQLISRSATLAFRCEKKSDYLLMHDNENSRGFFGLRDVGGASVPIIGENVDKQFKNIDSYTFSTTLIHEEQHALKSLFKKPKYDAFLFSDDIINLDPKIQQQEVDNYLEYKAQKLSFDGVANEIFAFFKAQPYLTSESLGSLTSEYNFSAGAAEHNKKYLKEKFTGTLLADKIDEYVDNYFANNYNSVIDKGIEAIKNLNDYCKDSHKAVALLMDENLVNWPKVVKRVLSSM